MAMGRSADSPPALYAHWPRFAVLRFAHGQSLTDRTAADCTGPPRAGDPRAAGLYALDSGRPGRAEREGCTGSVGRAGHAGRGWDERGWRLSGSRWEKN